MFSKFFGLNDDTTSNQVPLPPTIIDKTLKSDKFEGKINNLIEKSREINLNKITNIKSACSVLLIPVCDIKKYTKKEINQYVECLIKKFHPDQMKYDRLLFIDILRKILAARLIILKGKSQNIDNEHKNLKSIQWKFDIMKDDLDQMVKIDRYEKHLINKDALESVYQENKESHLENKRNNNFTEHPDLFLSHVVYYIFFDSKLVKSCNPTEAEFKRIRDAIKNKKSPEKSLYAVLFGKKSNTLENDKAFVKIVIPKNEKNLDYLEPHNIAWFFDLNVNNKSILNQNFRFTPKNDLAIEKIKNSQKKFNESHTKLVNDFKEEIINLKNRFEKNIETLKNSQIKNSKEIENLKNEFEKKLENLQKDYKENIQEAIKESYGDQISNETEKQTNQAKKELLKEIEKPINNLKKELISVQSSIQIQIKNVNKIQDDLIKTSQNIKEVKNEANQTKKELSKKIEDSTHTLKIELIKVDKKLFNKETGVVTTIQENIETQKNEVKKNKNLIIKSNDSSNKRQIREHNKSIMRYFLLGTIVASMAGCLTGEQSKDYRVGLGVGLSLFAVLAIISICSWKRNAENKEQDQNIPDLSKKIQL